MRNAWDNILSDGHLTEALDKLSVWELKRIIEHVEKDTSRLELKLLLTVGRVLQGKVYNEIYAEQGGDLSALNQALAPFNDMFKGD